MCGSDGLLFYSFCPHNLLMTFYACRSGRAKDQESGNMPRVMVSLFNLSHLPCESCGLYPVRMKRDRPGAGFSPTFTRNTYLLNISFVVYGGWYCEDWLFFYQNEKQGEMLIFMVSINSFIPFSYYLLLSIQYPLGW